jgi:hypothetical protein
MDEFQAAYELSKATYEYRDLSAHRDWMQARLARHQYIVICKSIAYCPHTDAILPGMHQSIEGGYAWDTREAAQSYIDNLDPAYGDCGEFQFHILPKSDDDFPPKTPSSLLHASEHHWAHHCTAVDGYWAKVLDTKAEAEASIIKYAGHLEYEGRCVYDCIGSAHSVEAVPAGTTADDMMDLRDAYDKRECGISLTAADKAVLAKFGEG